MAPDDGYSIMTHPEGKKKCLSGYFLQLQPHCIYLVSCRDTLIKLPDNFWWYTSDGEELLTTAFSLMQSNRRHRQAALVALGHSLTSSHFPNYARGVLKVGQVWLLEGPTLLYTLHIQLLLPAMKMIHCIAASLVPVGSKRPLSKRKLETARRQCA